VVPRYAEIYEELVDAPDSDQGQGP
jgi:hypothetical protein